jgi:hypothetical protein
MARPSHPERRNQRGVIVLWFAFFLLTVLFFVALGVDGAKLAATHVQLQNAADAAALAGASAIDTLDGNAGQIVPTEAVARAQQTALLNRAMVGGDEPVELAAADIDFPQPHQCRVVVRREAGLGTGIITAFARVVGLPTLDTRATATAELSPANEVCDKLVPMGAIHPPSGDFVVGCENHYQLKNGAGGGVTGNYQLLSFPSCAEGDCAGMPATGANTMRCLVANGYGCCVKIGEVLQTEPGVKAGPFIQAMNDRFDRDNDRREGICYADYRGKAPQERVVYVPKISALGNGRTDVQVDGFTAFFLTERPRGGGGQNTIQAEFLYNVAPGRGGGDVGPGTTLFVIRLVH